MTPPARGVGPDVTGEAQALVPALAGAGLDTPSGSMSTAVLSVRPRLSVTVRFSSMDPVAGARMLAIAVSPWVMEGGLSAGAVTVHSKVAMPRPQAAALADAFKVTAWPGATLSGSAMAAIGRSAASTELAASTMPAPQVSGVHRHCSSWTSSTFAGT